MSREISGVYKLNDTINFVNSPSITESVNLYCIIATTSSLYYSFDQVEIDASASTIKFRLEQYDIVWEIYNSTNKWGDGSWWCDKYQTTWDFGSTPQTVSDNFYEWLHFNGFKVESSETIIGTWEFYDTLTPPPNNAIGYKPIKYTHGGLSNTEYLTFEVRETYLKDGWGTSGKTIYSYSTNTWNIDGNRRFIISSSLINTHNDPEFITWLKANATKVEEKPTLIRKLTRLYLGDVVAKGTTRQLRKLTTEKPNADPYGLIGTWVFYQSLIIPKEVTELGLSSIRYDVDFVSNEKNYSSIQMLESLAGWDENWFVRYRFIDETDDTPWDNAYNSKVGDPVGWQKEEYRTINITGGADITNEEFATWLKANATKQESIVGTWYFNEMINNEGLGEPAESGTIQHKFFIDFHSNGLPPYSDFKAISIDIHRLYTNNVVNMCYWITDTGGKLGALSSDSFEYGEEQRWNSLATRTITITGGTDINNETFITWLKANATKIA